MQNSKITKLKANRAKQHRLIEQQRHDESVKGISELKDSLENLYTLINGKKEVDLSQLSEQINTLSKTIDIKDQIDDIKEAIKSSKTEFKVEKIDLSEVIKAIESSKTEINLSKLEKAIVEVSHKVQEQSQPESQLPEDYKPFRRVVKVGNRLVYDDQPTTASRSGGGAVGLTDTELRATPLYIADPITKKLIDDTTTTSVTYIGEAALGTATNAASWRIKKVDESGSPTSITWTGTGFDAVWDNRATTEVYS